MERQYRYGIVGDGRWSGVIRGILGERTENVTTIKLPRRGIGQSPLEYGNRIKGLLEANIADLDIVWIATPPVDQEIFVDSVLSFDKHVIVEKPWLCDRDRTRRLIEISKERKKNIAVHYQYCYLSQIAEVVDEIKSRSCNVVSFEGEFCIDREDRLSIPSRLNLGVHLLAVKNMYFEDAITERLLTGYGMENKRNIVLTTEQSRYEIDFLRNREPIIQRFVEHFERCVTEEREFPLDLKLSMKKLDDLDRMGP